MNSPAPWRLGHRPALDAVRGIAVTLVVLAHARVGMGAGGAVGVTVFFTLSGFLITALLLEERADTGTIHFRAFYARRAYRLLPALVLFLAAMGIASLVGDQSSLPTGRDFLGALFYVGNFTSAIHGHDTVILHTWSLSVEEQFYVAWPLVLVGLLSGGHGGLRRVVMVAAALSLLAVILRVALYDGGAGAARVTYGTDTRADGLLIGCILAVAAHRGVLPRWGTRLATWLAGVALALLAMLAFVAGPQATLTVPTVASLLTVVLLIAVVLGGDGGVLMSRPVRWLGRRSYAVYLWHYPAVAAAAWLTGWHKPVGLAVAVAFTLAMAHLSWVCVELPFLQRKTRFERTVRDASQGDALEEWRVSRDPV